ncbi:MBL fold metallo-hydrolase [Alkalihalobacterium alkalinitrilicum]|uniref:MBL fold metallo-hydrolase n=1 Tax=Alkalihalobacterium alkalinitrilicum TaxID=427920 RepID=UPI000995C10D|nr:MBL fold metallo-hydrolase [Alkalihalobacterium alkalinitrilicum]
MNWKQIPLGPLQTNCYLLINDQKEAVIFDPGGNGPELNAYLKKEGIEPLAILLTHAHFDHIGAVDDVRNEWGIDVYLHTNESAWLGDATKNGSAAFLGNQVIMLKDADHLIQEEGTLSIGPFNFSVYETPGHSPGSVSFYFEPLEIVFSGDALFAGSIGRTDLREGNHQQLLDSIHDKLLELPENTIVASGHGTTTTIGQEMDSNPFLSGF